MPIEIQMPQLDSDMTVADVVAWLVEPGEEFKQGDVILEIETDKSTVEIEAPATGVLVEILVAAGTADVPVGQVLALINESVDVAPNEKRSREPEPEQTLAATEAEPTPVAASESSDLATSTALARRIADQAGIQISSVDGSGARGRVTKHDVERSLEGGGHEAPLDRPAAPADANTSAKRTDAVEVPHTRMRRTIARRLSEAKQTIPHFYLSAECVMDAVLETRRDLNTSSAHVRISVNDFVLRAAALALREVPEANAAWSEDAIIRHADVDVSVAVATDGGLVTPIIRQADRKGLAVISVEMRDLAERARQGKLTPAEYQGGGFTVSNLGMYGIDSVYPIVNPPQSCILGVGAASEQPVVIDGRLAVASVMTLTLSADHRVVDGAIGAQLLGAIKRRLEAPLDMLLG